MNAARLAPFVPRITVERSMEPGSHWQAIDGSMLSADISGFTALSERLAGKGKAGAEEITVLINTCFEALIGAAYGYGGEVITFGGDALLVLFRGDDHERRAANAGLAMQQALATSGAARRARLTMTVGVGDGPFDCYLVGGGHRELLIIGEKAGRVIELESAASKGQTLASATIAACVDPALVGDRSAGGRVLRGAPTLAPTAAPDRRVPADSSLSDFVPTAVVDQLDAFADLGGEHRLVTVGFLLVGGIGELRAARGPAVAAAELARLIDGIEAVVDRYDVAALHTDIAPDGFKVVLCAGAPRNVGNTSDAMLRAALDLAALPGPFTLYQGVQTGRAFAGFLGSTYRRTYTLMGDVVNTAARMLGPAEDREVVAVADVLADARDTYLSERLDPLRVKGKREPITAHRVLGFEHAARLQLAEGRLHGRNEDCDRLQHAIDLGGRVVDLVGPAGSGKTRLIAEAVERAAASQAFHLLRGTASQFGRTTPYGAARTMLRTGLGLDALAGPLHTGEILAKIVDERCPSLAPMVPLLAVAIGADVPATPEAAAISEEFRRARIHDAVVDLIDGALAGDAVLVVEDAQWVDDGSRELVEHLARTALDRPWTVIVSRRAKTEGPSLDGEHLERIALTPLDDADVRRLAIESSERPLSDDDLAMIIERAAGNPLFALELTRAIGTAGDTVPDSVEKLLATRIDDLPPAARRAIRLAAVIGVSFPAKTLDVLLGSRAEVGLDDESLAGLIEPSGPGRWRFTQTLYRDAAYEGLPFARRRVLHRRVGEHLEASVGARIDEVADVLSRHFSEAGAHRRAWSYSVRAGDRAVALSSPVEAIEAYQRALAAGRHPKDVTRRQRSHVATKLGDAAERAGRYETATDAYRSARSLLAAGDHERLPLFRKQGQLQERQGRYDQAVRWYRRGLAAAAELDHGFPDEPAELAVAIAGIRFRQGRYDDCWETATAVAGDTTAPVAARFRAHYVLQLAGTYQGRAEAAHHAEQAEQLVDAIEDAVLKSGLYNNLGIAAYYAGEWDRAARLHERSHRLRASAGDISGVVSSLNNLGEIRSNQGHHHEARELLTDANRKARAAGYEMAVHVTRMNLGRLAGRQGRADEARELLEAARADFVAMSSTAFVAHADLFLLEVAAPGPDTVAAARELLARNATDGGGATVEVPTRRLLAAGLRAAGVTVEADEELEEAIDQARVEKLDHELLLCLLDRATAASGAGRHNAAELDDAEADDIGRRLGLVGTADGWRAFPPARPTPNLFRTDP
ncbi:MAG: adenylate/guanylate cyclase domain-containing protein [Actinomycetota bacterium]